MHAVASQKGCFVSRAITKKICSKWARKQTIQRSSRPSSTRSTDFSKIIKTKSGRVVWIIKNTKNDTVIAAYQLYKSRAREIEFVQMWCAANGIESARRRHAFDIKKFRGTTQINECNFSMACRLAVIIKGLDVLLFGYIQVI
jgi:hypothetical protein